MGWGRLHFEVSGGRGICFPGAAEPAGGGGWFLGSSSAGCGAG